MLKYHRTILSELSWICNQLGAELDYTSTHESKLRDRQRALMDVSKVLYGVLTDCKDNDHRKEDLEEAYKCMERLEALRFKTYPDRSGYLKPEEKRVSSSKDQPDLGICKECNVKPATTDYNGHQYFVCQPCDDRLNRQFDNEYQ